MIRYKAIIAYDGTNFSGFQRQLNARTVQEELEKTLTKIASQPIVIHGSGRTDAGVHALGQVIHFDLPFDRDLEKLRFALDTQSCEDIACIRVEKVPPTFHARYDVVEKTYEYRLQITKPRSPFRRYYAAYYAYPLALDKMQLAIKDFLGTHDFTAFCASGSSVEDKVRTIYEANIRQDLENGELIFTFRGDGFLYKMIRIMAGTLLKIGNDRLAVDAIPEIIASKNRQLAGPTAHPEGLYLKEVKYAETKNIN